LEAKKTYKSFRYQTSLAWKEGRKGSASAEGKPELEFSSPPEFKGDPGIWTPEDLLVTALNTCILETFLSFAERKGLGLKAYESSAEGLLEYANGKYRFTEFTVQVRIAVATPEDVEKARELIDVAHANCFVSNSITAAVKISPEIRVA